MPGIHRHAASHENENAPVNYDFKHGMNF